MSHFEFTLPGNHIPLLNAGCPGASAPRGPASICRFTFHQRKPERAALPAATAPGIWRDTPANCICRKIKSRCSQLATTRGRGRAKCLPGERSRAGRETGDSTVGRSTSLLGAASMRSAPGARSLPGRGLRLQPESPQPGTAPSAIKRRFTHFQRC